jgi:hypothetical protein
MTVKYSRLNCPFIVCCRSALNYFSARNANTIKKTFSLFFHVFVEGLLTSSRRKIPKQELKTVINTGFECTYADMAASQLT